MKKLFDFKTGENEYFEISLNKNILYFKGEFLPEKFIEKKEEKRLDIFEKKIQRHCKKLTEINLIDLKKSNSTGFQFLKKLFKVILLNKTSIIIRILNNNFHLISIRSLLEVSNKNIVMNLIIKLYINNLGKETFITHVSKDSISKLTENSMELGLVNCFDENKNIPVLIEVTRKDNIKIFNLV